MGRIETILAVLLTALTWLVFILPGLAYLGR